MAVVWLAAAWMATFVFELATFRLLNDHFDRISRGRQIAAFGELPFRDFFDGGYFMTEFSSAALFRLMGDSLLGEVLLNASFIATGATLVLLLARRASQSWLTAWVAMLLAVLAMPRAYDYDKFLFYPLGVLLCWRYIDVPVGRRLAVLGAGVVAAGLFRQDHAIILLGSAAAGLLVLHASEPRRLARQAGLLVVAMGLTALPFLVFIHYQAGIGDAVDQVLAYVGRERGRFRLVTPAFSFNQLVTLDSEPPPPYFIKVRWAPTVDDRERTDVARRYSLRDPVPDETDNRTASFAIDDLSTENLRALITDARVEDTNGIDRRLFVTSEPLWNRILRVMPTSRVRFHLSAENAQAFLNYLLLVLPLMAAIIAVRTSRGTPTVGQERARVLSLVAMCVLLDLFILQPVQVRGGGMAGPIAVLGAWLAGRLRPGVASTPSGWWWRRRDWWGRAAVALLLIMTAWSESVVARWADRVWPQVTDWEQTLNHLKALSASPPLTDMAPNRLGEMAAYVRACTMPHDRVFTAWYAPDLFYFSQRGFAGGMAVTLGPHWSEDRFQRRIVERLESQSVPLVILDVGSRSSFAASFPFLWQHLEGQYRSAGETNFGNPYAEYEVLVPKDRSPIQTDPKWSMPCFA
jgi:hypothetical protein